jgi:very-short-patch-repair endonuclease
VTADQHLGQIAARQHRLITIQQIRAAGLSRAALRHRVETGRWEEVRPCVYAIIGSLPSHERAVLAVVLASGPHSFASHLTAAKLWGLPAPPPESIEITTPLERQVDLEGVRAHRSGLLADNDVTVVDSIPVTAVSRMIVDLSMRLSVDELGTMLDEGMRRRVVSLSRVRGCIDRLGRAPGRSPKRVNEVLALRIPGYDPGGSDLEPDLWRVIVDAGFSPPVREHRVRVGGHTYRLDMAWPDLKVGVEVDGYDSHRSRTAFDRDRLRDNELVAAGWRMFHLTSRSTREHVVDVLTPVFAVCGTS